MGLVAVNVGFWAGVELVGPARKMATQRSADKAATAATAISVRAPILLINLYQYVVALDRSLTMENHLFCGTGT
jgi:hypothetical protein